MTKNSIRATFTTLAIASFSFIIASCGGSEDPSPADKTRNLLKSGAWSVQSVKVDGVEMTSLFTGLQITFQDDMFTAVNGGPIWGTTPLTWAFTDSKATAFNIGSGVTVTIQELTASSMKLRLNWEHTIFEGGRSKSLQGLHEFQFVK